MSLHDGVRSDVERATGKRISGVSAVGGGCVSLAYRALCSDGSRLFLKMAPEGAPDDMLVQEAASLQSIERTRAVRVPVVYGVTPEWLALEWLEPSGATLETWQELGRSLAQLHRARAPQFGRDSDNCIGPLRQPNVWTSDWPSFWTEQRLRPQLHRARGLLGAGTVSTFERLFDEMAMRLGPAAAEGPSLLHGDLWRGNVHFADGTAALIDPSSYYGHREVDLAMAALFGGFHAGFFAAYSAEWPLLEDAGHRRPVYQLYYLLVHVNLFGGGYIEQTRSVLDAAVRSARR